MAKTGSYIKLDRGLKNNFLWLEKPFSKGQAWVDLLLLAQGVDKDKQYRGKIQHMKSGEVYTSILYLTNRWGWSRNKVYRFLETLQKAEMIVLNGLKPSDTLGETIERTRNGTTNGTIITIEKWEVYQNSDTNNGTPNDTMKRTRDGTHNRKHIRESNTEKANRNKKGRSAPASPSGGARVEPDRDVGTYEDIPEKFRDGTWQSFKTYAEYYDWSNQ